MNNFPPELIKKILSKINVKQTVQYIPFGDGEQNYTIFRKNLYPYILVNNEWFNIYNNRSRL